MTSHDVIRTGKNAEVVKRNGDDTYYIEDVERGPVKAGGAGGAPPRSDRLPLITYNVRPEFGNGADLRVDEADVHPTLAQQTHLPGYDRGIRVQEQATVRRLTPLECERLMGWPEVDGRGWTDVPWNKKDHAPDSRRYAACGNGVVAPVAFWIGARLAEVLSAE